ncbi:MAG: T9SS type A sorting domain-containing protein, partial [Ignavibacteria bacterium]
NYPNPFNPTTKIDFDLPLDSRVNIKLYDISGREVKTIMNEQRAAGYYTVQFNSAELSSGVYFYRIMAKSSGADFIMTKKMMLIK